MLTDLGTRQYLDELAAAPDAVDWLYADALAAMLTLQAIPEVAARELPRYDRTLLMREMALMPEWFLTRHLGLVLLDAETAMLDELFETLSQAALEQPQCFVHRDFHSRNLLRTAAENPGVLDFQDAVWGPVTYDLASLLKDCYIAWPPARVRAWVLDYHAQLLRAGFELGADEARFLRWFDFIGLQRHLKVLGIFARLHYRDGKQQYLYDLPRVLNYVKDAANAYPETAQFAQFIVDRIEPLFGLAQSESHGEGREPATCAAHMSERPTVAMILAAGRGERNAPLDG